MGVLASPFFTNARYREGFEIMGMLVLRREVSEGIVMLLPDGSEIVVHVSHLKGKKVALAISAPAGVKVLRRELYANRNLGTGGKAEMVLSGLHASGQATAS
jgi:carbon storage regulator CsrA